MTSRAVQYDRFGGPEVLELVDREVPEPGEGQVRLAVKAASVNPVDWKLLGGGMAAGNAPDGPTVIGIDVAGVVDSLGAGVDGVAVGDEVLGRASGGSFAEHALADAAGLTRKPDGLSWDVAASLPVVTTTAYRVLALLGLGEGEGSGKTLVVDGASGGVGTYAVQLAVGRGATVIGTASPSRQDDVRALGAIPLVYGDGFADRVREVAPQGVDAAFDAAGKGSLPDLVALTGSPDRVITIADPTAADHGVAFTGGGNAQEVPGALADAAARVADGRLRAPSVTTYPLDEAARAEADNQQGRVAGKLVIRP